MFFLIYRKFSKTKTVKTQNIRTANRGRGKEPVKKSSRDKCGSKSSDDAPASSPTSFQGNSSKEKNDAEVIDLTGGVDIPVSRPFIKSEPDVSSRKGKCSTADSYGKDNETVEQINRSNHGLTGRVRVGCGTSSPHSNDAQDINMLQDVISNATHDSARGTSNMEIELPNVEQETMDETAEETNGNQHQNEHIESLQAQLDDKESSIQRMQAQLNENQTSLNRMKDELDRLKRNVYTLLRIQDPDSDLGDIDDIDQLLEDILRAHVEGSQPQSPGTGSQDTPVVLD